MYKQLLQNKVISGFSLGLITLLLVPISLQAQSLNSVNTLETDTARQQRYQEAQKTFQAIQKHYEDTHKSVFVTVDYIDVSLTDLLKASQWIASGQEHDAHLLAALIKGGAQDTKGTPVKVWDKMTIDKGKTISVIVPGSSQAQLMNSSTSVTPQFNADGTIAILIRLELGQIRGIPLPSSEPGYQCAFPTFHDGQTIEIGSGIMHFSTGASVAHLTFVHASTSTIDSDTSGIGNMEPSFSKPLGEAIVVSP